jgi:hypothetical protein
MLLQLPTKAKQPSHCNAGDVAVQSNAAQHAALCRATVALPAAATTECSELFQSDKIYSKTLQH